jgi:hypothetical protein
LDRGIVVLITHARVSLAAWFTPRTIIQTCTRAFVAHRLCFLRGLRTMCVHVGVAHVRLLERWRVISLTHAHAQPHLAHLCVVVQVRAEGCASEALHLVDARLGGVPHVEPAHANVDVVADADVVGREGRAVSRGADPRRLDVGDALVVAPEEFVPTTDNSPSDDKKYGNEATASAPGSNKSDVISISTSRSGSDDGRRWAARRRESEAHGPAAMARTHTSFLMVTVRVVLQFRYVRQ